MFGPGRVGRATALGIQGSLFRSSFCASGSAVSSFSSCFGSGSSCCWDISPFCATAAAFFQGSNHAGFSNGFSSFGFFVCSSGFHAANFLYKSSAPSIGFGGIAFFAAGAPAAFLVRLLAMLIGTTSPSSSSPSFAVGCFSFSFSFYFSLFFGSTA